LVSDLILGNVTQVDIQVVILLRFDTFLGDKVLRSCAVKITHTKAGSSPIKYVLTRDKVHVTKVFTTRGNLAPLYKRDSRLYAVSKTEANIHSWCFFALILTGASEYKRLLGHPFVFAGERFLDQGSTILRRR